MLIRGGYKINRPIFLKLNRTFFLLIICSFIKKTFFKTSLMTFLSLLRSLRAIKNY